MDYLDPKKKRKHGIQILIGYGLFAIAIGFATLVLVYLANGYDVDRNTGQVIQNGLVYIDSRPGGASVYLNGQKQRGNTDSRLVLPSGDYEVSLGKGGYRDWSRSLSLEGGSLRELTYARLIPTELSTSQAVALRSDPTTALQSIDKRWIVLGFKDSPLTLSVFDSENPTFAPFVLEIPKTLVTDSVNGTIEIIEWAGDDKTFLAKYTEGAKISYLLIDRENSSAAINLNTKFNNSTYEVSLRDRNKNEFFIYQKVTQVLTTATIENGVSPTPLAVKVQQYKTFEKDWLLYITDSGEEGLVEARFKRAQNDILLKKIKTSDEYLLQLAKLKSGPVIGISSTVENIATVYNDPEKFLRENPTASIPVATTVLRVEKPVDLRISADSSIILVYGKENFASHEFEVDRSYNFKVSIPIDSIQEIRWIDGQHFLFSSEGKQVIMDFDGSNMNKLVESMPSMGSFFAQDTDNMFSFIPATAASNAIPAVQAQLNITSLLTESDR